MPANKQQPSPKSEADTRPDAGDLEHMPVDQVALGLMLVRIAN